MKGDMGSIGKESYERGSEKILARDY